MLELQAKIGQLHDEASIQHEDPISRKAKGIYDAVKNKGREGNSRDANILALMLGILERMDFLNASDYPWSCMHRDE